MKLSSEDEREWMIAIHLWLENKPEKISELINAELSLPVDARHFLSDLVLGKVNKGRGGRPNKNPPGYEREIVAEIWAEKEKCKTLDEAMNYVQIRRGIVSIDTVRGIYEKTARKRFNYDNWVKWGRPPFK
jgi:hypothetical protein